MQQDVFVKALTSKPTGSENLSLSPQSVTLPTEHAVLILLSSNQTALAYESIPLPLLPFKGTVAVK
jgi:hypothetical protein